MTREEFESGVLFRKTNAFDETVWQYKTVEAGGYIASVHNGSLIPYTEFVCGVENVQDDGFCIVTVVVDTLLEGVVKFEDCETITL
jgi:hypothetical protein